MKVPIKTRKDKFMKNEKTDFWFLILSQIALAITDGALTYIATPDLSYEANPLVTHLGLGWGALFISNVLFIGLQIIAVYYAFVKYKSPVVEYRAYKEFSSNLFFKRPDRFRWMFYKLPKNWKPVLAMGGYALGITLPAARMILVFEWVLFLTKNPFENKYNEFRSLFPWSRFDISFAVVLAAFLAVYWTFRECRINRKMLVRNSV